MKDRRSVREKLYALQAAVLHMMQYRLDEWQKIVVGPVPTLPKLLDPAGEHNLPVGVFPVCCFTLGTWQDTILFLQIEVVRVFGHEVGDRLSQLLEKVRLADGAVFEPCAKLIVLMQAGAGQDSRDVFESAPPLAPFFAAIQHPGWFMHTSIGGEEGLFPGVLCRGLCLEDGSTPVLARHHAVPGRAVQEEARALREAGQIVAASLRIVRFGTTLPPPPLSTAPPPASS